MNDDLGSTEQIYLLHVQKIESYFDLTTEMIKIHVRLLRALVRESFARVELRLVYAL